MSTNRTTLRTTLFTLAAATLLVLGSAFAQPAIQVGDLNMNSGSLANYIQSTSSVSVPGVCYADGVHVPGRTYACFEQALHVSGLENLVSGSTPVTVFAPTDAAFASLESDVGAAAFKAFMNNPSDMATLVKDSIVNGTYTVSDLAYQAPADTAATSVTTLEGAPLSIAFGADGFGTHRTYVDVGPSGAIDGQSYVIGTTVMFSNHDVLIPLGRVTLTSLGS